MTPHGYIGYVGGVTSKAAAAVEAQADVLFVHPDNLEEATFGAAGDLEIAPVRSVEDALGWLTALQPSVGAGKSRPVSVGVRQRPKIFDRSGSFQAANM